MILVDTSVWVDHLRASDLLLARLLQARQILAHPFVVGELALGHLRNRRKVLELLQGLPQARIAPDRDVLVSIERHTLFGTGIGYIDAHLLATLQMMPGTMFWTRDKRPARAVEESGLNELFAPGF